MSDNTSTSYISTMCQSLIEYIDKSKDSQSHIAKELDVSKAQLSLFLSSTYTGNNQELAQKIEQYIRMGTARQGVAKAPDISLTVKNTKHILEKATIAHLYNEVALIYGAAGCGKTTALKHYAQNNNGVIYVEADATINSPRCILKLILRAIGEDVQGSTADMMQKIIYKLTDTNRLIIIDEAQHLTEKSFDTIRALNDKAHVGLVYAGNPSILKRMYQGRMMEDFDQVYSRINYKCELANRYSQADIASIYTDVSMSNECLKYLFDISKRKGGLRLMVNQCKIAQNIAAALHEKLSVTHLEKAAVKMGIGGCL